MLVYGYNLHKRLRKYKIIRKCLNNYLTAWHNKVGTKDLNSFYYATKRQLAIIDYVIDFIENKRRQFYMDRDDFEMIKELGNAKRVQYGNFKHDFTKKCSFTKR